MLDHHRDLLIEALAIMRCRALGLPASAAPNLASPPGDADRLVEDLAERGLAIVDTAAAQFAAAVNEQAGRPHVEVLWVVMPITRELLHDATEPRETVADLVAREARKQALKRIDEVRT